MVGIQIGKEQEERKREDEGLNFETTPWWNFITIMGYADEELRSASLLKLRAQPTAKAKAIIRSSEECRSMNASAYAVCTSSALEPANDHDVLEHLSIS